MKKTIKKMITILIAVLLMALPMTTAFAAEVPLTFGPSVTGVLDTDTGVLTISGTGEMSSFDYFTTPIASYRTSITSIVIENGVTSIGANAFNGCSQLLSITLPDSVTIIGGNAFSSCTSLASITMPNSMTSIGESAFAGCNKLTSITIPYGVTSIEQGTFYNCTSLTSITLPDSMTSIGLTAFFGCNKLTSITIPDSVTSIGGSAFNGCSSLTSISLPHGVTSIGSSAFRGCSQLSSITMPNSITSIGLNAFQDCTSLTSITIPDGVISIETKTFQGCTSLASITMPNSIIIISGNAFQGCTSLASITIPDGATSIGDYAFQGCTSLASITIPDGAEYIWGSAFADCTSLKTIINHYDGAQVLGDSVLLNTGSNVSDLKSVYCYPSNTDFSAAAAAAGYTVHDINDLPITTTGDGSVEATVPVNGTIEATTISISHPVSVEYAIDPNLGYAGGAFIAPDIPITNNSVVPVNVTVESLTSAAGGTLQFTDVAPDAFADWSKLNTADTKTHIALGVQVADGTGWSAGYKADTRYAVETGDTLFGTLNSSATGHMTMVASYGLAFDQNYTAQHSLVFMFDLA